MSLSGLKCLIEGIKKTFDNDSSFNFRDSLSVAISVFQRGSLKNGRFKGSKDIFSIQKFRSQNLIF